jgi:hypothetical protein
LSVATTGAGRLIIRTRFSHEQPVNICNLLILLYIVLSMFSDWSRACK